MSHISCPFRVYNINWVPPAVFDADRKSFDPKYTTQGSKSVDSFVQIRKLAGSLLCHG